MNDPLSPTIEDAQIADHVWNGVPPPTTIGQMAHGFAKLAIIERDRAKAAEAERDEARAERDRLRAAAREAVDAWHLGTDWTQRLAASSALADLLNEPQPKENDHA